VRVLACVRVRACVRARRVCECGRVCARVCVRVCVRARVCECVRAEHMGTIECCSRVLGAPAVPPPPSRSQRASERRAFT